MTPCQVLRRGQSVPQLGAIHVCAERGCGYAIAVAVGERVSIAGYPWLRSRVKSERHAEQIVRAHVFQHNRARHPKFLELRNYLELQP